MNPRFAFVAVLAAGLTVVAVSAQNRPDFSGHWTLVGEKSTPPNTWALGQDFAITQDSTTLTYARPAAKITYNLNGPETRRVSPPAPPEARPVSATIMTIGAEEFAATATWAGDHLVLVTSTTLKMTSPNREPQATRVRQTIRDVLSLDADGTLVVEHLITVDPPTSNPNVAQPVPIRSVYRKASR